jgi:trk system potassium uptake protein TrkA
VSPSFEISKIIRRNISISWALEVIPCADNKLIVIGVVCKKGAPIANVSLKYLSSINSDIQISIMCIKRGTENILPEKTDTILVEDIVYFACPATDAQIAMELLGYEITDVNNVTFIGGGDMCEEIVNAMSCYDVSIKVIEQNLNRAEQLSERLNNAEIFHGDPLDLTMLEGSNIQDSSIVISMTNDDKINILACLLSKKIGVQRVAAVVNDSSYSKLLHILGVNSILDSRLVSVSKILHYIKKGRVENIIEIEDGQVEIFIVDALNNSHVLGVLTDDIMSKNEVYIAAIVRDDEIFILPKNMIINVGDKVLFVVRKSAVARILKLFQEKPKYLA